MDTKDITIDNIDIDIIDLLNAGQYKQMFANLRVTQSGPLSIPNGVTYHLTQEGVQNFKKFSGKSLKPGQ